MSRSQTRDRLVLCRDAPFAYIKLMGQHDRLDSAGKVSSEFFERVIRPRCGRPRRGVIVGPQSGIDVGVVGIGHDQVAVLTTDPLYIFPPFGWERAAWFAVHIVASDAFTSGIAPKYASIDLNLPLEIDDAMLETIWTAIHDTCDELGIAVVTGHTGRYEGCRFPIVGAVTLIGIGRSSDYVVPSMAQLGDEVIVTKGPAIETTATIAAACPRLVAKRCGRDRLSEAEALFRQMSVVEDARTAAGVGVRDAGVTSMHDATEGGLWNALNEVSQACGCAMRIEQARIPMPESVRAVCEAFGIDPFCAGSEGTLVITCRPSQSAEVVKRLRASGIEAAVIGELSGKGSGVTVTTDGSQTTIPPTVSDGFWRALQKATGDEAAMR